MTDSPILELQNVTVRRERETLLDGVSFSVRRGSLHAVVGPNGAGKSTLLTAILGQLAFTGRIFAHWRANGRIGYVPQGFAVDRTLPVTVADFLALTRQRRPICLGLGKTARHRIAGLLDRVGLSGFEQRMLSVLSGGELRRVLLANALDPAPELLILDEPAGGLDQGASRRPGRRPRRAQGPRGRDRADGVARSPSGPPHRRSRHRARSPPHRRRSASRGAGN